MTSLAPKAPPGPRKKLTVLGVYNHDDPQLQVEFDRARELLIEMHETRRCGVRKKAFGKVAVQLVLVERY